MEKLFELQRRTFDTPLFRGIEFIEVEAKSILNKVPGTRLPFNWTINPYRGCSHGCVYCFARSTHTFLDMDAGRDFETKIVVKVNAPELVRREMRRKSWKGEMVALGTNTDPYQRAEGKYRLMPGIIEAFTAYRNPFSILTKGTLILRDLPLLRAAADVTDVTTAFSVPTLDEKVWRATEPGTPHPRKRLEAVARLNEAGIPCGVLAAPVLPGISDSQEELQEVITAAVDVGAVYVTPMLLHLRPIVRDVYMEWLAATHPHLVPDYEDLYKGRAYLPAPPRNELAQRARKVIEAMGGIKNAQPRRRPRPRKEPEPEVHQLSLL